MKYQIYQLKPNRIAQLGFRSLAETSHSVDVDHHYHLVYEDELDIESDNLFVALEELFRIFNIDHPADFRGHSLSVSDIVKLDNKYYFCQSFGWEEIENEEDVRHETSF